MQDVHALGGKKELNGKTSRKALYVRIKITCRCTNNVVRNKRNYTRITVIHIGTSILYTCKHIIPPDF